MRFERLLPLVLCCICISLVGGLVAPDPLHAQGANAEDAALGPCGDDLDNGDADGADCADASDDCDGRDCDHNGVGGAVCTSTPAAVDVCQETNCFNGEDDDGLADGTDCADTDCDGLGCDADTSNDATCVGGTCTEQVCSNGEDDDNDTNTDCADADCNGQGCDADLSNDATCVGGTCTEQVCGNGEDDDNDTNTDCADADCNGQDCDQNGAGGASCSGGVCGETDCTNGEDDDGDGDIDCADSDCAPCPAGTTCNAGTGTCDESNCFNTIDDDTDTNTDCADSDCDGLGCDADASTDATCVGGTCTEQVCYNGEDDDNDTNTDCADADCDGLGCDADTSTDATCVTNTCTEQACGNGEDDDNDTNTDCADADCNGRDCDQNGSGGASCNAGTCGETDCSNGEDDDGDTNADCADIDCTNDPACAEDCTNGVDDDADSDVDCDDTECDTLGCDADGTNEATCVANTCTEQACGNGEDDDNDTNTDCADADCNGQDCDQNGTGGASCAGGVCGETDCTNGQDDDGDGDVDCDDTDCSADPGCPETCNNGIDDDADTDVDCNDAECNGQDCDLDGSSEASCVGTTCTEVDCANGEDDDGLGDGIDCADNDCNGQDCDQNGTGGASCNAGTCEETDCSNGQDDDGDGNVDCDDTDCSASASCPEDCLNGIDDDADGDIDCDDAECLGEACDDGFTCTSNTTCQNDNTCGGGQRDHGFCDNGQFCDGEERCQPNGVGADPVTGCRDRADPCIDPGESCDETNDVCFETNCQDGNDNDSDGDIDCRDTADCPGCPNGTRCALNGKCVENNCADGVDNDNDGLIDCADPNCSNGNLPCDDGASCTTDTVCQNDGTCGGGTRNHQQCDDGLFCNGTEACNPDANDANPNTGCRNRADDPCVDDGEECIEAEDRCRETACEDDIDNDSDTFRDCLDELDCACPVGQRCIEMPAGDGDCVEDDCADGVDNDGNGLTDCEDPACDTLACDDGASCTTNDVCSGGGCVGDRNHDVCDDGLFCNGTERCNPDANDANPNTGCRNRPDDPCVDDGEDCDEANDACIEVDCEDGNDNDGDTDIDCRDSDCGGCPAGTLCTAGGACIEQNCADGVDNDGDGQTDCEDPNCFNRNRPCDDGFVCTSDTTCQSDRTCGGGTPDHTVCDDGTFCNGRERCSPSSPNADAQGCSDRIDPCIDPGEDCDETADVCFEVACTDRTDNDSDGDQDCLDDDCPCPAGNRCNPSGICVEGACDDGQDNDGDGLIDCADPNCRNDDACPEDCTNGVDDDADGDIDCADSECNGERCNDGFACTRLDTCNAGVCEGEPVHDRCDDGLFCNGSERCRPEAARADRRGCIDRADPCTDDGEACDETADTCIEVDCIDTVDNDGDTVADCDDDDCVNGPEDCSDSVDNNCNGLIDCNDPLCNVDEDLDGFNGAPCGSDCNDADPDDNPGADEDCFSPEDDDCDGEINCDDTECQVDADNDGQIAMPCGEDCDDSDPNNFFRNDEDCTDGSDNDCDTFVDCADDGCFGKSCDDGASCTSNDMCEQGFCAGTPDDVACDDGLFCTGVEECNPLDADADGDGCVSSGDPCPAGQFCHEDTDDCQDEPPCDEDTFEDDDLCAQARQVTMSTVIQSEEHSLCPSGDLDRIEFEAVMGVQYTIFTTGGLDTQLTLLTGDCVDELAFNNDCATGDPNACITWSATFTGTVVALVESGFVPPVPDKEGMESGGGEVGEVRMRGERLAGSSDYEEVGRPDLDASDSHLLQTTGDYTLWYQASGFTCEEDGFEQADDLCSTATAITPTTTPASQAHSVCPPGDVDRYRFLGEANTTYRFFTTGGTDTRAEVRTDSCGAILLSASDCDGDPNFCMDFTPGLTTFYTVNVRGQTNEIAGDYDFHYEVVDSGSECTQDAAEPDDGCAQGALIEPGSSEQTRARSICPEGDRDTFAFFAEAGKTYEFFTTGNTDVQGEVQTSACGTTLASASSCGNDPLNFCMQYTASSTGTLKLRVEGQHGLVVGDYVLHYRTVSGCTDDAFEPDDSCGEATVLTPDFTAQSQNHTICPAGEVDWFQFFAQQGGIYSFRSEGLIDTAAGVLDLGCQQFLVKNENCDGNDENFCLEFVAPTSGTYKLAVTGDGSGGPYTLVYERLFEPSECSQDAGEPDNVCSQGTAIVPSTAEQTMDRTLCPPDDRDHFTFSATAGTTYRFFSTGGTDTTGNIRDASCVKLVGNDDCNRPDDLNFCLTWTAPASGTYHLRVRGFNRLQTIGDYRLHYEIVP